jgi:hypothetical protein
MLEFFLKELSMSRNVTIFFNSWQNILFHEIDITKMSSFSTIQLLSIFKKNVIFCKFLENKYFCGVLFASWAFELWKKYQLRERLRDFYGKCSDWNYYVWQLHFQPQNGTLFFTKGLAITSSGCVFFHLVKPLWLSQETKMSHRIQNCIRDEIQNVIQKRMSHIVRKKVWNLLWHKIHHKIWEKM